MRGPRDLPSLTALRAFEAVARHGSAMRAADELAVTAAAVSHQIRHLEEQLGCDLFVRRPRQLVLTRSGEQLLEALTPAFDAMTAAVRNVRRGDTRRIVTMSLTPAVAMRWLLPRMPRLAEREPGLDLRLQISHELAALDGVQADLAIRYGRGRWPGLEAHRLFDNRFFVGCSPVLGLRRRQQLLHQTLLHFVPVGRQARAKGWPQWRELAGMQSLDTSAGPVFSDETHVIAAALAGQGVALMSHALLQPELASGQLVRPFGPDLPGEPFHLVYPAERRDDPDIVAVRAWLLDDGRGMD